MNRFKSSTKYLRLHKYCYKTVNLMIIKSYSYFFAGFKVITFKNPYLGNTCVPFQHWACSMDCAEHIEIPARDEQIAAAADLDKNYDAYVRECQYESNNSFSGSPRRYMLGSGRTRANTLGRCIGNKDFKDCIVS